jgi:hypothetical protein
VDCPSRDGQTCRQRRPGTEWVAVWCDACLDAALAEWDADAGPPVSDAEWVDAYLAKR